MCSISHWNPELSASVLDASRIAVGEAGGIHSEPGKPLVIANPTPPGHDVVPSDFEFVPIGWSAMSVIKVPW